MYPQASPPHSSVLMHSLGSSQTIASLGSDGSLFLTSHSSQCLQYQPQCSGVPGVMSNPRYLSHKASRGPLSHRSALRPIGAGSGPRPLPLRTAPHHEFRPPAREAGLYPPVAPSALLTPTLHTHPPPGSCRAASPPGGLSQPAD